MRKILAAPPARPACQTAGRWRAGLGLLILSCAPVAFGQSYSTNFPATENPMSQGGAWLNGATDGADWGDVRTASNLAFGTTVSGAPPYNDSIAALKGTWGATQTACAIAYTVNQNSSIQEEVEVHLRKTISSHTSTGYEFDFRVTSDGSQYMVIVRWNGALNSFTNLTSILTGPGIRNGDRICASAIGSNLAVYVNGVQVMTATDSTYTNGSPGIGFWNHGGTVANDADYGFSAFTAQSGSANFWTPPSVQSWGGGNSWASSGGLSWNGSSSWN